MTHDPFAVSTFALDDLPEVTVDARADFETAESGFGAMWIEYLGGQESASRFAWREFGPVERRGGQRLFALDDSGGDFAERAAVPASDRGDWLERNLALATMIDEAGGRLSRQDMKALPLALDVENKWCKRASAIGRAFHFAELESSATDRVNRVAKSALGTVAPSRVWAESALPMFRQIAEVRAAHLRLHDDPAERADRIRQGIAAGTVPRYPQAADQWFDADEQDRVAQAIIDQIRAAGRASVALRWDVFNLIEGFDRRNLPLSLPTQIALDHTLGLVDQRGHARRDIALGGIKAREAFMQMARDRAAYPEATVDDLLVALSGDDAPDISTAARWMNSPLFAHAVRTF